MVRIRYVLTNHEDPDNPGNDLTFDAVVGQAPRVDDYVIISHPSFKLTSANALQFRVSDLRWIVGEMSADHSIDVVITLAYSIGISFKMPGPAPA